ncbi:hypothetical protein CLOM_g13610 [Closterium sp. NIES-68]|nr:hypothetical protein CLOM_g13610 [Closterium sp. NIES-68]
MDPDGAELESWDSDVGWPYWMGVHCNDRNEVVKLSLSGNELRGSIPPGISHLTALQHLDVRGNHLQGSLVAEIAMLPALTYLDASNNGMNGWLPGAVANMTALHHLDLHHNAISGPLPSSIGALSKLTRLDLHSIDFTPAPLPPSLGALSALAYLNLAYTQLSGPLPSSLANLSNLKFLSLDGNALTGPFNIIPPNSSIHVIQAGHNQLSGGVPDVSLYPHLRLLSLHDNNFTGPVPTADLNSTTTAVVLAGQPAVHVSAVLPHVQRVAAAPLVLPPLRVPNESPNPVEFLRAQVCVCSVRWWCGSSCRTPPTPCSTASTPTSSSTTQRHSSPCRRAGVAGQRESARGQLRGRHSAHLPCQGRSPLGGGAASAAVCRVGAAHPPQCHLWGSHVRRPAPTTSGQPPPPPLNVAVATQSKSSFPVWAIVVTAVGVLCFATSVLLLLLWLRHQRRRQMLRPTKSKLTLRLQEHFVRPIALAEVEAATNAFADDRLLGVGGYGSVYRGHGPNGEQWAVKRAQVTTVQSMHVFQNEVDVISAMSHRNLIALLGYCEDKGEQILVYEFAANGTLSALLRPPADKPTPPLTLQQRVEIALGAAQGLFYLHSFARPPVIHRDVKSGNILLDADMQAKVADFGLLKASKGEGVAHSTQVAGTPGYLDPEYYSAFKVTAKSDVYSFGVVLLEIITGLPPIFESLDSTECTDGERQMTSLARWCAPYVQTGNVAKIVDPRLGADYPVDVVKGLADVAMACVQRHSKNRPTPAR